VKAHVAQRLVEDYVGRRCGRSASLRNANRRIRARGVGGIVRDAGRDAHHHPRIGTVGDHGFERRRIDVDGGVEHRVRVAGEGAPARNRGVQSLPRGARGLSCR